MKDNEKATTDFIRAVQENNELLLSIMDHMKNHMNVNPEDVNYAHVGSANHITGELKNIKEFLNI